MVCQRIVMPQDVQRKLTEAFHIVVGVFMLENLDADFFSVENICFQEIIDMKALLIIAKLVPIIAGHTKKYLLNTLTGLNGS